MASVGTMKQLINLTGTEVKTKIISGPIPTPSAHQVLIKVVVSGSNPKDWKRPAWESDGSGPFANFKDRSGAGINQGDDIAGIVEKVGEGVLEFKVCCCGMRDFAVADRDSLETVSQPFTKWVVLVVHTRNML